MSDTRLSVTKRVGNKLSDYVYHRFHRKRTAQILENIGAAAGKINPKLIRLSDEYARDVLGWGGYAPWLYVYSAMQNTFKEGWIPDNYYGRIVVPMLKGQYGATSELKTLHRKLFSGHSAGRGNGSVFPDLVYSTNGLLFSNEYTCISRKQAEALLFEHNDRAVFKTDNSEQGKGVSVVDRSAFGTSDVQRMGNGVFQSFIQQHEFFDAIMPESAATLRMTTAVDDAGGVSLRACYLRLGRLADTHVKSESNIRIPVSRESGELGSMGFLPSWQPTDVHPDTGVAFNNLKIPQFHDCVSTAKDLHRSVPFVRCIGWDMVVDKNDNIKVMEWNGVHNDIKFSESTQGPCFADLGWEKLWQGCNNRGR